MRLFLFFKSVALRRDPMLGAQSEQMQIFVGCKLWLRYEMPLWYAWVSLAASLALIFLTGPISKYGTAGWLIANLMAIPLLVLFAFGYFTSIFVTLFRLGDLTKRILAWVSECIARGATRVSRPIARWWQGRIDALHAHWDAPLLRMKERRDRGLYFLFETERGQKIFVLSLLGVFVTIVACFPAFFWGALVDFWEHDKWILKPFLVIYALLIGLVIVLRLVIYFALRIRKEK